ncbi:probable serine/threonine-protein kinase dyrk2 isoform X2 [Drosophila busckii]|uniref:probable serine/threonine-protein kinase dyrk2 isoform X2 n=1 Tax=Drosophila busckii TaxID=30019 RepID=UPI00083F3055|nr:probable serine/threonine-protein kinase dyrk2 isoform X2 [Drosophila busckii]
MSNQLKRLLFIIVVISGALCTKVEDYVIVSPCAHNKNIHIAAEGTVSLTGKHIQNITIKANSDIVNNIFKISLFAKETQRYLCFNETWGLVGMREEELRDTCYFNESNAKGYYVYNSVVDLSRRVNFTTRRGRVCDGFEKQDAVTFIQQKLPERRPTAAMTASSGSGSSSSKKRGGGNKRKKNNRLNNQNQSLPLQHHGHNRSSLSSSKKSKQQQLAKKSKKQKYSHRVRHHHDDQEKRRKKQHEQRVKASPTKQTFVKTVTTTAATAIATTTTTTPTPTPTATTKTIAKTLASKGKVKRKRGKQHRQRTTATTTAYESSIDDFMFGSSSISSSTFSSLDDGSTYSSSSKEPWPTGFGMPTASIDYSMSDVGSSSSNMLLTTTAAADSIKPYSSSSISSTNYDAWSNAITEFEAEASAATTAIVTATSNSNDTEWQQYDEVLLESNATDENELQTNLPHSAATYETKATPPATASTVASVDNVNKNIKTHQNNTLSEPTTVAATAATRTVTAAAAAAAASTTAGGPLSMYTQEMQATPFSRLIHLSNRAGDINIASLDNISVRPARFDDELIDSNKSDSNINSSLTNIIGLLATSSTSELPESLRIGQRKINAEMEKKRSQHNGRNHHKRKHA